MSAAFRRLMHRLVDWVLRQARRDPDIGLDEYREFEKQANELRERINKP